MKKNILLLLLLAFVAFTASAQNMKVAVMETKVSDGVSEFQGNMVRGGMEAAVALAEGYEGYDRASFDKIMQEHNFERSGAVEDSQIKELGKMAGVDYVLVTEASTDGEGFFITAKLLDVETGLMEKVVNTFCDAVGKDIYDASTKLGQRLFDLEEAEHESRPAVRPWKGHRVRADHHARPKDTVAPAVVEAQPVVASGMEKAEFESAIKLLQAEGFDNNRLEMAKQMAASNPMSVQQIIEICKLFSFENNKLDFAKHAYSTCTEKGKYYLVNEVFSFSSSKTELQEFIGGK